MKNELQNILSGKSKVGGGDLIQAAAGYLGNGKKTSGNVEGGKHFKEKETARLKEFIAKQNLWVDHIDFTKYISEGAEQRVYLKDTDTVSKLNDSIFYVSWRDYFYNLLLHYYFFPETAYNLKGFIVEKDVLYAVVEQPFIKTTKLTDLHFVKEFLEINGFRNVRNNDYINDELGIILEDLHDENVLNNDNNLFFIDTAFFLTDKVTEGWNRQPNDSLNHDGIRYD